MKEINYEELGKRLYQARIRAEKTLEESGDFIGVHKSTIMRWENGETEKFKIPIIEALAIFYKVDPSWLMGCDISMNITNKINNTVPLLGIVKGGFDYFANENIIGYIVPDDTISDAQNCYALEVTGDSMYPFINEGSTIIVHKQEDFENEDTCIVLINGDEATVKVVKKTENGITLISHNPTYPKKEYTQKEIETLPIQIIGVVKQVRSNTSSLKN